jgi:hypothetical protein
MSVILNLPQTMTYALFRSTIQTRLRRSPAGMSWKDLRQALRLPYRRPCPEWVRALESDIGLERVKSTGRALVWRVPGKGGN